MKKRIAAAFLAVVLCMGLAGCGGQQEPVAVSSEISATPEPTATPMPTPEPEVEFDFDEYEELVSPCYSLMMESALDLSNIGSYEFNYWEATENISGKNARVDYDKMANSALEWFSEKSGNDVTKPEDDRTSIRDMYKEIILVEVSGKEAIEIEGSIKEMFAAYESLYSLVMTPSGSRSSFSSAYNEAISVIQNADSTLSLFFS